MDLIVNTLVFVADSALDVLPIVAFLFAFQWFVIGEKMRNGGQILIGFLFVVVGLGLFPEGLEQSLFPLGRMMAEQLTHPEFLRDTAEHVVAELTWKDFYWVYIFAATVGFSTAMAEPSLIAVAMKANTVSGRARLVGSCGAVGVLWGCPGGGRVARSAIFSTRLIVPTTSRVWALSYSSPELLNTRT